MLTKHFRQIALSSLLLGVLSPDAALAETCPPLESSMAMESPTRQEPSTSPEDPTTQEYIPPSCLPYYSYTTTWDTFTTGLATGKWFNAGMGAYWANNAVVQGHPNSLYVYAPGVNSLSGYPAFTLSIAPEAANGGYPGAFDHMKWLVYMNKNSLQTDPATGQPFKGFDTKSGYTLSCSTKMTGQTFGTRYHPFGTKVSNSADDVRLSSFAMATFDPETNMVFDFLFTNRRIYAIYERLPYGRTEWGGTKSYAAFTYAIPVGTRTPTSKHQLKISYYRSAGVVQWFLDGREVYRVSNIGRRLSNRQFMILDLGGTEETVIMRQLNCGMGMFTLLDGALGNGDGLVRLSQNTNYHKPSTGAPNALPFFDNNSLASSRIWGQGAEFHLAPYVVSSVQSGSLSAEPTYTEPIGSGGADFDSAPVQGNVVF